MKLLCFRGDNGSFFTRGSIQNIEGVYCRSTVFWYSAFDLHLGCWNKNNSRPCVCLPPEITGSEVLEANASSCQLAAVFFSHRRVCDGRMVQGLCRGALLMFTGATEKKRVPSGGERSVFQGRRSRCTLERPSPSNFRIKDDVWGPCLLDVSEWVFFIFFVLFTRGTLIHQAVTSVPESQHSKSN